MSSEHWIHKLLPWLASPKPSELDEGCRQGLMQADYLELESLLGVLEHQIGNIAPGSSHPQIVFQLMAARVKQLLEETPETPILESRQVANVYEQLVAAKHGAAAAHLLQLLAIQADAESLLVLVETLQDLPPEDWQSVGIALSPLWSAKPDTLTEFFEQLDGGFLQPSTTAVLLDLANYSVREGNLETHPWASRAAQLSQLLQQVIYRLRQLEKEPQKFGDTVDVVQQALADSVALTVSLCDGLGQIADSVAKEPLIDALSLSHRRIQTEAAAALSRLNVDEGKERLIALSHDAAARTRVVAYAEELGLIDSIPEEYRTPQAAAESELASWLADPAQFGIAPQQIELIEHRTQYWPSYEEPKECYLFRFTYSMPQGPMQNVGISGPLTHCFQTDLSSLPVDDLFAVFAGWQAEHEEIFEVPANQLNEKQQLESERMLQYLNSLGYETTEPIALTLFFGETALIGIAEKAGKQWVVLTDGNELVSYPSSNQDPTALSPELVLCLFRGRKLLRTFNG